MNIKELFDKQLDAEKRAMLRDTDKEYRVYYIKKADGGKRVICQPSAALMRVQGDLLPHIKAFYKLSKYATAYETGCSIKKNAEIHANGKYILHADIKNFFPSIKPQMIKAIMPKEDLADSKSFDLFWRTVSYKGGLPIGAPTSPALANRVMYNVDKKLARLSLFVKYSRYADDMIFSAKRPFKKEFITKVERVLTLAGFSLNKKKTYFMKGRKEVTGIIVNNGKLSVGTGYKKRLKSQVYDLLVKKKGQKDIVRGKLAFLNSIEPAYATVIKRKYKAFDKIGLFD